MRHSGVELGYLTGAKDHVVFGEDQPKPAIQHVHPLVALMRPEIRLGPDGKGEGKLVPAAKINYDKETNTLEIENYNTEPTRLTQVEVEK